ncbi:hypothetical protein BKA70DRAFT_525811 [Coprinopsis sp. MPI-PUGE-AT-0042]|nr:hypothetical protein BKA70DRAFT_525811 [Coprinopsis sp. MPI-PUGE-AT-0042]
MASIWDQGSHRSSYINLRTYGAGLCPVGPERCQRAVDIIFRAQPKASQTYSSSTPAPELIGGHKLMLAEHSEGFPHPNDVMDDSEPVVLTEDATTVRLLFIFLHSKDLGGPPIEILRKLEPEALVSLALAADKYMVHYLVGLCRLAIEMRAKEMPFDAFYYGLKRNDADILDLAAPLCVGDKKAEEALRGGGRSLASIPPARILRWYQFREFYLEKAEAMIIQPPAHINSKQLVHSCGNWEPYAKAVFRGLPTSTLAVASVLAKAGVKETLSGRWDSAENKGIIATCRVCKERAQQWEGNINKINCEITYSGRFHF